MCPLYDKEIEKKDLAAARQAGQIAAAALQNVRVDVDAILEPKKARVGSKSVVR